MDYKISEDRLFEVFSHYMEKRFGTIHIANYGNEVYFYKDGTPTQLGYVEYIRSAGQFMFVLYSKHNQMFNGLKNTFGDVFDDLLLRYLQTNFPEYNIEGVY